MYRLVFALLSLFPTMAAAPAFSEHGAVTALAVAMAVLLAAAYLIRERPRLVLSAAVSRVARRQARERGRRGAFQRQCRPDTHGRPRPRAPGNVLLPA